MKGKYTSTLATGAAWLRREHLRRTLAGLVSWPRLDETRNGCTAVIGMCSRLPHVLAANLRCLDTFRWPALNAVVIAVDATHRPEFAAVESTARSLLPKTPVRFVYYSESQSQVAERLKLPYVYSWLSWCSAIATVETEHVLIHDYDALVVGPALEQRYDRFATGSCVVQGIRWYDSNGVEASDRLCTTFEMLASTRWLRSLDPIELFNKVRVRNGRSIDYDTTLDAQDRTLDPSQRQVEAMDLDDLVHPSQMIHQYTMFRRRPAGRLPCFSMPMIPFFSELGGRAGALKAATAQLERSRYDDVELFSDGTRVNLELLDTAQVDWSLKQMIQACLRLAVMPSTDVYAYGTALYRIARAPAEAHWAGDFTPVQRVWIASAAAASGKNPSIAGDRKSLEFPITTPLGTELPSPRPSSTSRPS